MKKLLNLKFFMLLTLCAICFTGCSDDDDSGNIIETNQSIADFVASNAEFSMLNEALTITNLNEALNKSGTFTVFAPNNAAFSAYLGDTALADFDKTALRQLLLNHVISSAAVLSSNLTTGYLTNMATFSDSDANLSIYISTAGSAVSINGEATVIDADNEFTNGVVHVVDAVIPLPDVTTFASADPNFSTLVAALTRESDFKYIATLETSVDTAPAPFTVFAPTNAAFTVLLQELNLENLADIPTETLQAVLNLHVIAGANVRAANLVSGPVTTLGGNVDIDAENATITDANGRISTIVVTDIQAANGVIHAIDIVLLPEMGGLETIADFIANNADYSLLLEALQRTDLDATLNGEGTFTVFAPTNDAFETFLGDSSLDDVDVETLRQLLLNHVLSSTVLSSDITTGYVNNMATFNSTDANLSTYLNIDGDGVQINGSAMVTGADNEFINGVVHTVDAVIALPTVVTFATADPTFSSLVAALTREESFTYVNTLSTPIGTNPAPFTVFAPTNAAFESLLADDLGDISLNDIPTETLEATLNLHVIAGSNLRAADLMSGAVTTLGGTINLDAENTTITDANGRVSNIIVTDVQASNGVVHAIDKVILPALN